MADDFEQNFDATIADLNAADIAEQIAQLRAAEKTAEEKKAAEAAAKPSPPPPPSPPAAETSHPSILDVAAVAAVALPEEATPPPPTSDRSPAPPKPPPALEEESSDSGSTVILDTKQHAELMALRAQQDHALSQGTHQSVAVMFTDLVGSTAYYERYGDMKGREKVLTHNAMLFPMVTGNGGVIIKTIGDAIMAYFESVNDALHSSVAMQYALAAHNQDIPNPDDEIHIRIALNYGVAIAEDGDLHGDVVNVAARIEHEAQSDEIWVSESVQRESAGWPFENAGQVAFKGKTGLAQLYSLDWEKVPKPEAQRGPAGLPEKYEVLDMLSHGSIGDMFRGRDTESGRDVIIKGLNRNLAKDPNAHRAFAEAVNETMKVDHEGVVQIVDSAVDSEEPYFVTEFIPSVSLSKMIKRHGLPKPEYAALITYRLCQILAYAHSKGVLHGDLKPENVLVSQTGEIRLINFGAAKVAASQVEKTGAALGDPSFMAPEQVVGAKTDPRSDVYSLGALLYYLLCHQSPYGGGVGVKATREVTQGGFTPIKKLNPEAPEALVEAIGHGLSIIPDMRPPDAASFAAGLAKHFMASGLEMQRNLVPYLTKEWVATIVEVSQVTEPAPAPPVVQEAPEPLARRATELETPVISGVGPVIGWPIIAAGAVLIAVVFFGVGWKLGESRAREYYESAMVDTMQQQARDKANEVPEPAAQPQAPVKPDVSNKLDASNNPDASKKPDEAPATP